MLLVDSSVELESNSLSYRLSVLGCFCPNLSPTTSLMTISFLITCSASLSLLITWPSTHSSSASLLRNSQLREFTWKRRQCLIKVKQISLAQGELEGGRSALKGYGTFMIVWNQFSHSCAANTDKKGCVVNA